MKTLLIGLDGATFSILDPMVRTGVMPFLGRFMAEGVRSNLRSVIPPLTPPAWTSLMTGRSPGYHGIFDFFRMESSEDRQIRFVNSHDVSCETIWSMASRNGLKVAALNFPLMYPPPKISGYVIPGWVPWRVLPLACFPEQLFDRLKTLPGFNPRELAMDIKLEERATEGGPESEHESWVELHTRRERNWFEILRYLLQEDDLDLGAVLLDGMDKLQHLCWRFIDPDTTASLKSDRELRIRDLCLEYYRCLDQLIEQIADQVGPETTIYIASDHGFGPTTEVFHINAWLEQRGYLAWSESAANQPADQEALLGVGQVARHTYLLDWNRTKAFTTTPTSNGVYIVVARDRDSHGVPASEYDSFRAELMRELLDFKDPASGEAVVSNIWTREEVFPGPHTSVAPDLTLALRDGGLVSILPAQDLLEPRSPVAGAHRPTGVFLARGPAIRKGLEVPELSILDIAPSLLYSLGLPIPEDLEGRAPEEIFEAAEIQRRPIEMTEPTQLEELDKTKGPQQSSQAPVMGPQEEKELADRLRQLGYIE